MQRPRLGLLLVLAGELAFLDDVVLRREVLALEVPVQHVFHSRRVPQLQELPSTKRHGQSVAMDKHDRGAAN